MLELTLCEIARAGDQLSFAFKIGDHRFTTAYWYDSVDFHALETRYGAEFMERVLFHIAAFEINKIASLRPDVVDWGPYARFADEAFEGLWRTIFRNVWAQWRFENDDPRYDGPEFRTAAGPASGAALGVSAGGTETLCFVGGGKDSLVAAKLLERLGEPYDSLVYSSSIYGTAQPQHDLIGRLVDRCTPVARRRQWIYDDFLDSPVIALNGQGRPYRARTLTAAETPSSIFASLPYALQHGYTRLCLAHERSADTGQVIWDETGEDVNHQWGKSFEAESLINAYLQSRLISNLSYFSILKPIYDVLIFNALRANPDDVRFTHSCNIRKPWCMRCSKCLYVWINYMAYLPFEVVNGIFGANLADWSENAYVFRQLLGLTDDPPFECIGSYEEVKLAFALAAAKGLTGRAVDIYRREVGALDYADVARRYTAIDRGGSAIPEAIAQGLFPYFQALAEDARSYIGGVLQGGGEVSGRAV